MCPAVVWMGGPVALLASVRFAELWGVSVYSDVYQVPVCTTVPVAMCEVTAVAV